MDWIISQFHPFFIHFKLLWVSTAAFQRHFTRIPINAHCSASVRISSRCLCIERISSFVLELTRQPELQVFMQMVGFMPSQRSVCMRDAVKVSHCGAVIALVLAEVIRLCWTLKASNTQSRPKVSDFWLSRWRSGDLLALVKSNRKAWKVHNVAHH